MRITKIVWIATFICSLLFASAPLHAQVLGKQFPNISGETLDDKVMNIPEATMGKITLLGMAYSKDAEKALESWLNPTYNKFIARTGMFDAFYDVNVIFIPMFTGVNAATANTVKKKVAKDAQPEIRPHVLFYKGDLDTYREALGFEKRDVPYFFILDKQGKIIHTVTGAYSENKMEEIEDILIDRM